MPLQVGEQAPIPNNHAVELREHPGGWYAAGERRPWLAQDQSDYFFPLCKEHEHRRQPSIAGAAPGALSAKGVEVDPHSLLLDLHPV